MVMAEGKRLSRVAKGSPQRDNPEPKKSAIPAVQARKSVVSERAPKKSVESTGAVKANGTLSPPPSTSPSTNSMDSSTSTLLTPCSSLIQAVNGFTNGTTIPSSNIKQTDLGTHFIFARNVLEASCIRAGGLDESPRDVYSNLGSDYSKKGSDPGERDNRLSRRFSIEVRSEKTRRDKNSNEKEIRRSVADELPPPTRDSGNALLNDTSRLRIEGLKWMKKLANGTATRPPYGDACAYLADLYDKGGLGLVLDRSKAFGYWVLGAKQSHPYCSFRVAKAYENGFGTKRDSGKALQFYRKAAALGDANAMHKLGIVLLYGHLGCTRSDREAVSWLKRAIAIVNAQQISFQGGQVYGSDEINESIHAEALYELACLYERGTSSVVIRDEQYAFQLYQQAATFGHVRAQHRLGIAYENGDELGLLEPNPSLSVHFYRLAAELGSLPESQFALSGWYLTGIPDQLEQSELEAYAWARRAADQGHSRAEYAIGYFSETGIGTKPDLDEAMRWYMRAAQRGCKRAKRRLKELKRLRKPKRTSNGITHETCPIS